MSNPFLKVEILANPSPSLRKLGRRLNPPPRPPTPAERMEGCTLWSHLCLTFVPNYRGGSNCKFWGEKLKIIDNFTPILLTPLFPRPSQTIGHKTVAEFDHYGLWVWVNLVKKKICDKNLFQIILNEVLKYCKN